MKLKQIKISDLNDYISKTIKNDFLLKNVIVEGEISNINFHHSKTIYFTIKDNSNRLQCVFFDNDENTNLFQDIEIGDLVLCTGTVKFYHLTGSISLIVRNIVKKELSDEKIKFDLLKEKLEKKGYFDINNKKKLPENPKKIGIITSPTGAVIHDIYNVIKRRYPIVQLYLYPTSVQGEDSEESIVNAISSIDEYGVDTIILARGGGSSEDMKAFNSEKVADAIYNCKTPIISAIGHEVDFTISDYVADVRASTPSVAGEIAVPDIKNMIINLENKRRNLQNLISNKFDCKKKYVENKLEYLNSINFSEKIYNQKTLCYRNKRILDLSIDKIFKNTKNKLEMYKEILFTLNPENMLDKGWSLASKDSIIKSVNELSIGDEVNIKFKDGYAKAKIFEVLENED